MTKSVRSSALTDHLGYWLRYVSNHVSHAFALRLAAKGVTVAEWACLRELLDSSPVAPCQLADRLGLTRGAISKLADRLISKGLIQRYENEADRRGHSLQLSAAGHALLPKLAALADANDAEFFGHLTTGDRETIEQALREIVRRRGLRGHPVS